VNAGQIKCWIVEAPIWDEPGEGIKQSFRREEPGNLDRNKPRTVAPGTISTDLRWGSSLATRGQPDVYKNHRTIHTHDGPQVLPIYHIYRRKVGEKGPGSNLLTRVKSLDYPGAENMLGHATGYLEKVVSQLGIKATLVVPAPSSKPLASRFAAEVAKLTGGEGVSLFDKVAEAKSLATSDRTKVVLVQFKEGATEAAFDQDVVLVDDITTSDQTISQMAQLLWDTSLPRSVKAVVLIGRA
jgi:hypothetical protein